MAAMEQAPNKREMIDSCTEFIKKNAKEGASNPIVIGLVILLLLCICCSSSISAYYSYYYYQQQQTTATIAV